MDKEQYDELDGFKKGGWVRFYSNGKLVIGQIEYLWIDVGGFKYAGTDVGSVSIDAVLEHRGNES